MTNAYAVIPAAGVGERMATQVPKQYCKVLGKPLIFHTVDAFLKIPLIQKAIVVCSLGGMNQMKEALNGILEEFLDRLVIIEGERTRHRSIAAGVKYLDHIEPRPDIVIIHDGVRPLVPPTLVLELVQNAVKYGSAGPIRPLVSTVLAVNNEGFLEESLDRSKYCASEMPQAFQYDYIRLAYEKCSEHDFNFGTECLHLVHKYCNVQPKLVNGGPDLWKVTHKKDLYAAEGILREKQPVFMDTKSISGKKLEIALKSSLSLRFSQLITSTEESPDHFHFWAAIKILNVGSFFKFVKQLDISELQPYRSKATKLIYISLGDQQLQDQNYIHKIDDIVQQLSRESLQRHLFLYFVGSAQEEPSATSVTEVVELVECFLLSDARSLCGRLFCI